MKKILSILMMLMLMMGMICVFSACSSDDAVAEDVPEEEEIVEEEDDETSVSEENLIALETDRPFKDPSFFLTRKSGDLDLLYSLDNEFYPIEPQDQVGYMSNDDFGDQVCTLYSLISSYNNGKLGFNSHGQVPILTLQPGDRIVSIHEREIPKLRLYSVDYYGNTIDIRFAGAAELYLSGSLYEGARDVQVEDEDGNVCEDWYALEANKAYTVSWYEGSYTEVHKAELYSNCESYTFKSDAGSNNIYESYDYEIEGVEIDGSAAEYDLSNVPAGMYRIGNSENGIFGGLIRVE